MNESTPLSFPGAPVTPLKSPFEDLLELQQEIVETQSPASLFIRALRRETHGVKSEESKPWDTIRTGIKKFLGLPTTVWEKNGIAPNDDFDKINAYQTGKRNFFNNYRILRIGAAALGIVLSPVAFVTGLALTILGGGKLGVPLMQGGVDLLLSSVYSIGKHIALNPKKDAETFRQACELDVLLTEWFVTNNKEKLNNIEFETDISGNPLINDKNIQSVNSAITPQTNDEDEDETGDDLERDEDSKGIFKGINDT